MNIHHFLITRTAFFLVQQKFKQLMKLQLHFCCNAIFHLQVFETSLESAIVHAYQCFKLSDINIFDIFCSTIFHFRYLKNPQQETIVHAKQYVKSFNINTFIFLIFQIFEISSSRCNCECMPICVKLSDIDILGSTSLAFQLLNWRPYSYLSDFHESFSNYARN